MAPALRPAACARVPSGHDDDGGWRRQPCGDGQPRTHIETGGEQLLLNLVNALALCQASHEERAAGGRPAGEGTLLSFCATQSTIHTQKTHPGDLAHVLCGAEGRRHSEALAAADGAKRPC